MMNRTEAALHTRPPSPLAASRAWLLLALCSLVVAGALAALLALARTPPFDEWVTDPGFFRRCLVVHVNLSLSVWSIACLAALFSALPSHAGGEGRARLGAGLAAAGLGALITSAWLPGAPVMSNYIPVIDAPLFFAGLVSFAAGALLAFANGRLLPGREDGTPGELYLCGGARVGLRAAAVALLFAFLTFGAALIVTPAELPAEGRYELIFWGGGHIMQVASEAGMLVVWLLLLGRVIGRPILSRRAASWLFGLLIAPTLAAPLLAGRGTGDSLYQSAFTTLMQWGIFPVVLVVLALCLRALARAARERGSWRGVLGAPETLAFLVSATLTGTGFVLGALIRGPNTMIPAHYHACFGGVTAAYMGATYVLLGAMGRPLYSPRLRTLARWQPLVFGLGQLVFALGFALAGLSGMGRKLYGAEQHVRTASESAGLLVMGIGGVIAVVGGVAFLVIALRAALRRGAPESQPVQRPTGAGLTASPSRGETPS